MSAYRTTTYEIPEQTKVVAKQVYSKGNRYLALRDELGPIFRDESFSHLFAVRGRPAEAPGNLALVLVVQYMENLSDRLVADAVRSRIDLKYLLGLELSDSGFHYSILSEFRRRLIEHSAEALLFETILELCRKHQWLKARGQQRTDSTHVLAAVRSLNRYELIGETLRHALNIVAVAHPRLLQEHAPSEWHKRYDRRIEQAKLPKGQDACQTWATQVGYDGLALLAWVEQAGLQTLPAVQRLKQVWSQQFLQVGQVIRLRQAGELPPAAEMIQSPYDDECRYSQKRTTEWAGYKVHLTESCDPDLPRLITQVTTTAATRPDFDVTSEIQADLAERQLTPAQHVVDNGYTDAALLVSSQRQYAIDLVGPVAADGSWQAKAGEGFDLAAFQIDWDNQVATCPRGQHSGTWSVGTDDFGHPAIHVRFRTRDCLACPARAACTRSAVGPRGLRLRPQAEHLALQAARQRQRSPSFQATYAIRAGVEGTVSQAVRSMDLRRSRYIGLAKTHLQHLATAAALNLARLADFLLGHLPAVTRRSAFAALA
jgi:transposase